jgi:hypothetical protein
MALAPAITDRFSAILLNHKMAYFPRIRRVIDNARSVSAIENLTSNSTAHRYDYEAFGSDALFEIPCCCRDIVEHHHLTAGSGAQLPCDVRHASRTSDSWRASGGAIVSDWARKRKGHRRISLDVAGMLDHEPFDSRDN